MQLPNGELVLRTLAMPADTNANGDIFGGWLMAEIDMAGAIVAVERSKGPVVTVAVKELHFLRPIFVYDVVSFYATVTAVGNTSMTVTVDAFSQRFCASEEVIKVAEAVLVYVAVSKPGATRPVPR